VRRSSFVDAVMQQPAHPSVESIPEEPFAVAATASTARPRRTLKHGDTFILVDSHGDIGVIPDGADGLFHTDTRFLSRFALTLEAVQPLLLGSNVYDDNSMLTVDLTNPDTWRGGRLALPKDTVHLVRTLFLWRGTAHQRLAVGNYGDQPVEVNLSFAFDSDFADLFES
jgi:glycogen debranching enzyme